MSPLKTILRSARSRVTQVLGPRRLARLAASGEAPIPVLFYHRVADATPNAWTISCRDFERQINFLRNSFEVIGLDEVQRRVRERDSRGPAVAITFDDGYAENCDFALPLLIRHRLPCTYFVALDHIQTGQPFPHDAASGAPLPINTAAELRDLAAAGIEVGLHTRSHFDFSKPHSPAEIAREISSAAPELSKLLGRRVRYFAFPYGLPQQLGEAAIRAVAAAGMDGFCSAFGAYNVPGRDAFHIRRVHGDPDFARFRNWVQFDRRKLRHEPQIHYDLSRPEPSVAEQRLGRPVPQYTSAATR